MGRILSAGSNGLNQTILPANLVINVGPTRTFTTIGAAVASLAGKYPLGTVTIQLDDGTYNETTLTFSDPNYSGKLIIQGDLNNPQNCIINFTDQSSNGFNATNGFNLILNGGYTINGMFNVSTGQYTFALINAGEYSSIRIHNSNTITLNNSVIGIFSNGYVGCSGVLTINNVFRGINCDGGGKFISSGVNINATSVQQVTITNAQMAATFYVYSTTYPVIAYGIGVETGQHGEISIPNSIINGFYNGFDSGGSSNIYAIQSTFSNISNAAVNSQQSSNIIVQNSSYTNCNTIARANSNGVIYMDNPSAITGCTNLALAYSGSIISANGTSGFSVSGTKYNQASSNVAGSDGSIIIWS
jgi:hypothetical protein